MPLILCPLAPMEGGRNVAGCVSRWRLGPAAEGGREGGGSHGNRWSFHKLPSRQPLP